MPQHAAGCVRGGAANRFFKLAGRAQRDGLSPGRDRRRQHGLHCSPSRTPLQRRRDRHHRRHHLLRQRRRKHTPARRLRRRQSHGHNRNTDADSARSNNKQQQTATTSARSPATGTAPHHLTNAEDHAKDWEGNDRARATTNYDSNSNSDNNDRKGNDRNDNNNRKGKTHGPKEPERQRRREEREAGPRAERRGARDGEGNNAPMLA